MNSITSSQVFLDRVYSIKETYFCVCQNIVMYILHTVVVISAL